MRHRWNGSEWARNGGFVVVAAVVACGRAAPASPPAPVTAPAQEAMETGSPDTTALARDIPGLLREADVPGLSIAVVRDGRVVWTGAFGTVNDSARTPLDDETVFEAASLSKPVFAWLVLRLAERGAIDLDRPLLELVEYPRLAGDPRARRITARMVLSHSTGLPNWGGDTLRPKFEPGTAYGYSGEAFGFLQKAVERVTGEPLEELARREVFRPLGMTRSSFVWEERFAGNAAWAKSWLWRTAPVNRYADANAAYTLLTTGSDYARFVAAVLTGEGLSPASWKAFLTPVRETSPGIHIGLGIRLEDGPGGRRFYHSGSNGRRFTSYMAGDLASGVGLAFFAGAYDGTSLVRPLASRAMGDSAPPRHWDWFDRHDDPALVALKTVQRAAVDGGEGSAREALAGVRLPFDQVLELGAFLEGRGLASLAVPVLERAVAAAPDSAAAHLALGRALESAGRLQAAIASYRRAERLEEGGAEAREHIRWAQERVAARARSLVVDQRALKRYAGDYRERTVTLREGRLYYGGGADPESALVPMGEDLFEVERNPATRIRFVGETALVAIHRDGTTDRWMRGRR